MKMDLDTPNSTVCEVSLLGATGNLVEMESIDTSFALVIGQDYKSAALVANLLERVFTGIFITLFRKKWVLANITNYSRLTVTVLSMV